MNIECRRMREKGRLKKGEGEREGKREGERKREGKERKKEREREREDSIGKWSGRKRRVSDRYLTFINTSLYRQAGELQTLIVFILRDQLKLQIICLR